MSAPIAPGDCSRPSDTDFGEHGDQQRAVLMRLVGDRLEVAHVAEHVRRLHDDAGYAVVDLREDVLGGRDVGRERHDVVARHPRQRLDHIDDNADADRRRAPPCGAW